ncbi:hypothetical protein IQ07DRAFT_663055 [Pyrenochaeta sp. DS3sAY3a]|nr:hypothetical protein IQ07DRAFT_663055 [Pyrenochaeta sp. DS3sAY3a]
MEQRRKAVWDVLCGGARVCRSLGGRGGAEAGGGWGREVRVVAAGWCGRGEAGGQRQKQEEGTRERGRRHWRSTAAKRPKPGVRWGKHAKHQGATRSSTSNLAALPRRLTPAASRRGSWAWASPRMHASAFWRAGGSTLLLDDCLETLLQAGCIAPARVCQGRGRESLGRDVVLGDILRSIAGAVALLGDPIPRCGRWPMAINHIDSKHMRSTAPARLSQPTLRRTCSRIHGGRKALPSS